MKSHVLPTLTLSLAALLPLSYSADAATTAFNFFHTSFAANTGIDDSTENTDALNAVAGLDSPNWYNLGIAGSGGPTGTDSGDGIGVQWWSSNAFNAGSEGVTAGGDASQQVFRMYLDDGDGGTSYAAADGYGVTISVTGLSAYLASQSATSYTVTLFLSTDSSDFTQPEIRDGALTGSNNVTDLSLLGSPTVNVLGDGTQPVPSGAQSNTGGTRGVASLTGLTADEITIAMPTNAGGGVRGSIAGFAITAVPEPSSTMMLGLAGVGFILRRRR
ncbi:PEP-CTERM protein-sorting domain-containing protein [Rubritalea squalenifaciens DSM 18772]|uniref:PEP-CTERM protein-sorting domain-containing protein n=1 Tax=Rubritalea squalenifaciens DSM 18772 TaxID=1123071 RepID=A0A1M6H8L5_9BACT|nr:PEP-CTERM sorting domain-containing protein [Rubritalea squalenifaciens]SHJ18544.1 PEP-CTERM protein-sorting domain-containing protein [Rubritalea squalenifaciens DSM 18772]